MKHLLKKRLLVWLMCIFVIALGVIYHPANAASAGNIYYVDIIGGDDHNDGLSQSKAFKTLGKVNSINYQPGDKILFKASGIWTGQLKFQGSGTSSAPIVIDMYGNGSKPVIDGAGLVGEGVVYIYNQEYIEVNNLEITNDAPDAADRRGVEVIGSNFGTVDHIVLRNLNIHNVKGIAGNSLDAKRTAAIYIATRSDDTVPTRFNNVLIEGCTITSVDNQGIITNNEIKHSDYPYTPAWNARRFSNLIIRNNVISDIGKNAIVTRLSDNTCLVEYNVCYDTAVRAGTGNTIFSRSSAGTVFQFNEGYRNLTVDYDGCLYNADLNSVDCIFQYSYSHDNNHGLFWMCTKPQDKGNIVRYNISQNDKGGIFTVNYPTQGLKIYNNTVYIGPNVSPKIIYERHKGGNGPRIYSFENNIIYNMSNNAVYDFYTANSDYVRTIDNNLFYGVHPQTEPTDNNKITLDPLFAQPGSGGYGINTLAGYKLTQGSPAINSGKLIANNGGMDFFGNQLTDGYTDIGAHEYQGTSGTPTSGPTATPTPIPTPGPTATPTPAPGSETTVTPIADSYVRDGGHADTNYGNDIGMMVKSASPGYRRKSYARFDFSAFSDTSAHSAVLRVYVSKVASDSSRTIKLYGTSDESWSETSITWNNAPAGTTYIGENAVSSIPGVWYEYDVTSYVNSNMSDKIVSFLLINEGPSSPENHVTFATREASAGNPQLIVTP